MSSGYIEIGPMIPGSWRTPVATASQLPTTGNSIGDVSVAQDSGTLYEWNGTSWQVVGGGGATGITALTGDVTASGTGSVPATVNSVGGVSAANVASGATAANAATPTDTPNTIVERDASGNFSAGTITANLTGNATTAVSFTGPLLGDVTGTQSATAVSKIDGNTVSGTTGTGNVVFSASPTLTGRLSAGSGVFTSTISASNLSGTNTGDVTIGTSNGLSLSSQVISLGLSSTSTTGALSSTDWNTFNSKESALTPGTISTTTPGVSIGNGNNSTVGPAVTVDIQTANSTQPGLLDSADWNTFNNKQGPLTLSNLTDTGTDGIVITGGTGAVIGSGTSIAQTKASASQNGYLASTDWTTFNNKGSVSSVAITVPNYLTVSGSPITTSGTIAITGTSESANQFLASPNGSTGVMAPRSIVASDLPNLSGTYVTQSEVGTVNGVASLDSSGHVPLSQLPPSLVEYLGTWNASTNVPTLANGTGSSGQFYIVSTAGTTNFGAGPITFNVGDWVLYNGTIWERAVQSNTVQSVNGQTGIVTINAINQLTGDVTTSAASGSQSEVSSLVATSNSTLVTLSSLSLPGTQITGNISGTSSNITALSNSTLTTLPSLSLPTSQLSGTINLTTQVNGVLPIANGGTSQTTASTARGPSGLNIDRRTTFSNANYSALNTDRYIGQIGTMSGTAVVTLPAASSVNPGQELIIADESGTTTSATPISIAANGSDTINGSATKTIKSPYGWIFLKSNGTNAWIAGVQEIGRGGTGVSTVPTNGQLLIGNTTNANYTVSTLTAGSGVTIVNAPGSITINATGTGGTVTSASVVSANGFAGTVATSTTTPAITLSTTVNSPVLSGNGTAISAATTTGTGSTVVLNTSPTLVTPVLGTPSSGTATNLTGLPLTTGVTGVLPIANGGTAVSSVTTTPTALAFAGWDANTNISANNLLTGYTSTVSSGTLITLTANSPQVQYITGSSSQTLKLPVASTLTLGQSFTIVYLATGSMLVQSSGGNNIGATFGSNVSMVVTCILTSGTTAASWNFYYIYNNGRALITSQGGTGQTAVTTTPTAVAFAGWDANKNMSANNFLAAYTTTATAAGTTALLVGSSEQQYFTGTTTQTVTLPVTSTLVLGASYTVTNLSTGVITVQSSGASVIQAMAPNTQLVVTCILTSGTTAASWNWFYSSVQSSVISNSNDITENTFNLSNTQTSPANVTGLSFANAAVRAARVFYCINVSATSSLYEAGTLQLVQKGASWEMSQTNVGDNSQVVFTVTTAGQIQYTTPTYTGFSSAFVKFRADTL